MISLNSVLYLSRYQAWVWCPTTEHGSKNCWETPWIDGCAHAQVQHQAVIAGWTIDVSRWLLSLTNLPLQLLPAQCQNDGEGLQEESKRTFLDDVMYCCLFSAYFGCASYMSEIIEYKVYSRMVFLWWNCLNKSISILSLFIRR